MIFFKISFILIAVTLVWHFLTKSYLNPYKLVMVFGKKGSGKTTYLTKQALKYLKKGWNVYSTEPIPGCHLLSYSDIGYYKIPPNSLLIVDEVGMVWDNRDFKNFKHEVRDWFKLQRHERVAVILASQTFDIDKKLRDLCDSLYLVRNFARVWTVARKIERCVTLVAPEGDGESRIEESLRWSFFLAPGAFQFTFIPVWSKYFNSFAPMGLKEKHFPVVPGFEASDKLPRILPWCYNIVRNKSVILLRSLPKYFRVKKRG